ncbi:hypothetical protein GGR88_001628 [Sphingomonas jejuensis]|uniref:Alpha-N-arabinofuranosidase n=1 Tax=Sphingomonas jejuensis TaxID=904715 RepID=A0ABX0XLC6_9SPHN|nr:glycoside hydrolase family 43 protein [Sphingomonas jejuensis]NJC34154.1 hypothetical protein [Sphingomonas jejuensis]
MKSHLLGALSGCAMLLAGCAMTADAGSAPATAPATTPAVGDPAAVPGRGYLAQPLVRDLFFADPSAHVFNGKLYIYPSHDIDTGVPDDDLGSQYAMRDYHVLSMDRPGGPVTVHPVALDVAQVPWASARMWAPDAAYKNGTYYLYFPAHDRDGVFRIGVATSQSPTGPFTPEAEPIRGSFSIDPSVFTDTDGGSYMYFGGIWGGQLQRWQGNRYDASVGDTDLRQDDRPAIAPRVARMTPDMKQFAEAPREIQLLDQSGQPILGGDHERRFFEAAWTFKRGGKYYFTYSTGDTHRIAYAIGDSPYGPFRFTGFVLEPVQGWTNHHSIVEWDGRWWLFYHDTQLSQRNHLRSAKMTELRFNADGTIQTVNPFRN